MYRREDKFQFPADHAVRADVAAGVRRWQEAERAAILRSFTHVIVESGQRLFDSHVSVVEHLKSMSDAGLEVALLFHGSDIRLPSVHARTEPESPFQAGYEEAEVLERIALRNSALVEATDASVFVSTPDLLAYVPSGEWLPVVVDPVRWEAMASSEPLVRSRPVVVHAPSRAALKGSRLIEPALRRLHIEGVIEYREVHGVRADDMPAIYGDSDIVLDQFSLGSYGVAACEAMASGRLVISHVARAVRDEVRERTGHDLPVLEANADGLERVLRNVIAQPATYRAFAARGPGFVSAVHDGRRSAAVLAKFLGV